MTIALQLYKTQLREYERTVSLLPEAHPNALQLYMLWRIRKFADSLAVIHVRANINCIVNLRIQLVGADYGPGYTFTDR